MKSNKLFINRLRVSKNNKNKTRANAKSKRKPARFKISSQRKKLLYFIATFVFLGGGVYLWRALASDELPSESNQLIISYELGMPHQQFEDNFPTGMAPAMLLYGDGKMLCTPVSDSSLDRSTLHNLKQRQLSRQEVRQLVDKVKDAGLEEAIQYKNETELSPPISSGRHIVINRGSGTERASRYPGDAAPAFEAIEVLLQDECEKTTEEYSPDDIVVEAITLPENHPEAPGATTELPKGIEISSEVRKSKATKVKGREAAELKKQLKKETKVYRKADKVVRVRYLPVVPSYEIAPPKQASNKGKAYAASQLRTKWIYVVPAGQATPGDASSKVNAISSSIRNWYTNKVGKSFDIDNIRVVTGQKTESQYRQCPSGKDCQGSTALAAYYNLQTEFGEGGYSINVLAGFNHGQKCLGLGGPLQSATQNSVGVYNYGFAMTPVASEGCYWEDALYSVPAHEAGHTFGLVHTCDSTLMDGCGYTKPVWPSSTLQSTQASLLRNNSPYFNPYQVPGYDCSGITKIQQVNFNYISSPATPTREYVQTTTAPDGSQRQYYYQYSGSGAFYNHNINYISPTNTSYAHSDINGAHGIKLDYSPYFNTDPSKTYKPGVNYHYIYRWVGELYVQQNTVSGSPTTYTKSSGDGTGGQVTDQLTKTKYVNSTNNTVYGPQLGPCTYTGSSTGSSASGISGGHTVTDPNAPVDGGDDTPTDGGTDTPTNNNKGGKKNNTTDGSTGDDGGDTGGSSGPTDCNLVEKMIGRCRN